MSPWSLDVVIVVVCHWCTSIHPPGICWLRSIWNDSLLIVRLLYFSGCGCLLCLIHFSVLLTSCSHLCHIHISSSIHFISMPLSTIPGCIIVSITTFSLCDGSCSIVCRTLPSSFSPFTSSLFLISSTRSRLLNQFYYFVYIARELSPRKWWFDHASIYGYWLSSLESADTASLGSRLCLIGYDPVVAMQHQKRGQVHRWGCGIGWHMDEWDTPQRLTSE